MAEENRKNAESAILQASMMKTQRKIFLYLKIGLQAYKSRRADPPSWIVGGFATKEIIDRALFKPTVIDPEFTKEHVALLGEDPGEEVDTVWWEDMLVNWFEEPEEEGEEDVDAESSEDSETNSDVDKSSDSIRYDNKRKKPHPNRSSVCRITLRSWMACFRQFWDGQTSSRSKPLYLSRSSYLVRACQTTSPSSILFSIN